MRHELEALQLWPGLPTSFCHFESADNEASGIVFLFRERDGATENGERMLNLQMWLK